jgi:hypothetical protein
MQDRKQHCQSIAFQAHRQPPRVGDMRCINQRLHLDQQRPAALQRHQHTRTRHPPAALGKKNRRGIGDRAQATIGHCKDAQLVDRSEPVLEGAHHPVGGVLLAFEVEHRVDDVLEHPGTSERAFLGHVADHHQCNTQLLRDTGQLRSALAHLGNRPGSRLQLGRDHGLDRVDHHHRGAAALNLSTDALKFDLGQHWQRQLAQPQTAGPQRNLPDRFLAAHIERARFPTYMGQGLKQQG